MVITDQARVAAAIAAQGSPRYNTPSGAFLTLLSEFAAECKLVEMSEALSSFEKTHPLNAGFVREAVPAKVLNYVFAKDGSLDFASFEAWQRDRKNWAEELKTNIGSKGFEKTVNEMRDELRALAKQCAA